MPTPKNKPASITETLLAGIYWENIRVEYDGSDNPIYVGFNENVEAAEGDTDWDVLKINYTGSNAEEIQHRRGSWTGRAGIAWTI